MTIEKIVTEVIIKQGIMGVLLVIFIYMFRQFINRLFRVVQNNTEALTKNAEVQRDIREIIAKCDKR